MPASEKSRNLEGHAQSQKFPPLRNVSMKKNLQINTMDNPMKRAVHNKSMRNSSNSEDPHLVCNQRELNENIEDEIKAGFFELRQKFCDNYPSSIYISHIILH